MTVFSQSRVTISGFVKELTSQELLSGVDVYVAGTANNVVSNAYGFYSLTVFTNDSVQLVFSHVGYKKTVVELYPTANDQINVLMPGVNQLDEVNVSARKQDDYVSRSAQMGKIAIPIQQIRKIPAFFGEKDVLKVLQLMPGVQKGSEGQTGLYVRGGGPDQNLIILDDAVVYNANHLFGFFSIFNSDALKSVELNKGGFPARFGGRLSSVLEMHMKEGSKDKLHAEGGIGLVASRLTLEGPLAGGKSSFLISARRTYIDLLLTPLLSATQKNESNTEKPGYYFYDLNAKLNYDFGQKDKLYLSGYFGRDRFYIKESNHDTQSRAGLDWGNNTATFRWNHLFNQTLFANTSLIVSNFSFGINNNASYSGKRDGPATAFSLGYDSHIRDYGIKTDFDYYINHKHWIKFGAQFTLHHFSPSAVAINGSFFNQAIERSAERVKTVESGLYIEDTWQVFDILKMNVGMRISTFKTKSRHYIRPEPRFSAVLRLAHDLSFKASYTRMNQYVHLLSNTGLGLPTDLWVPTTDRVAPQQSRQVAFGLAKDLANPELSVTLEGYYKNMDNMISYKEGASFLSLNGENASEQSWEDNVTTGRGWSYGLEFLVHKKKGKFSGWTGYTLSWTKWQFPELNFGQTFFPRYDRRHDISVVGIYELNKRISLSGTWVYGTGNALTMPSSQYNAYPDNVIIPKSDLQWFGIPTNEYGQENSFRAEPYHRLDLAVQFHKKLKRYERTWEISIYNAYNRRNPFFYNIDAQSTVDSQGKARNKMVLKRYSLFPLLPSVSYAFKF